jgi:hypothetical protein
VIPNYPRHSSAAIIVIVSLTRRSGHITEKEHTRDVLLCLTWPCRVHDHLLLIFLPFNPTLIEPTQTLSFFLCLHRCSHFSQHFLLPLHEEQRSMVIRISLTGHRLRCSSIRSEHAHDFVVSPSSDSPSSLPGLPSLDADLIAVFFVHHGRPPPDGLSSSSCSCSFKQCSCIILVSHCVPVLFPAS